MIKSINLQEKNNLNEVTDLIYILKPKPHTGPYFANKSFEHHCHHY
jgi:hypothetical protein